MTIHNDDLILEQNAKILASKDVNTRRLTNTEAYKDLHNDNKSLENNFI